MPDKVKKKHKQIPLDKNRRNELDVDFIGDPNRHLTEEEAKGISNYIKAQKAKAGKIHSVPKKYFKT